MNTVSQTAVDAVSDTILVGSMTDIPACINDSSTASGVAYKTHRSTNAIKLLDNTPFAGEAAAQVGLSYSAISVEDAVAALQSCPTASGLGQFHIVYTSPYRFGGSSDKPKDGGANYVYADTHGKFASLPATLNPNRFQWGKRAWTAGGGAIYKPGTSENVD
jgi:hypothetical protein